MAGYDAGVGGGPTVTSWGAARAVTGSQHLVATPRGSILLDCGLLQGRREEVESRNLDFPFRVGSLGAVIVSHAHIDHCGNLPSLIRKGYRGPIFCTPMTLELTAVMLADSAKLQEEESAHAMIRRRYSTPWLEPLYTTLDAARATGQLVPVPLGEPFEPVPGVTAKFSDAGHVPGSAVTHLRIEDGGLRYSLTYTGDLGRPGFGVLPPPAPLPQAGMILCESTYGGRRHPDLAVTRAGLAQAVLRAAERGGKLIIPAFGFARAQIIVHFLLDAMRSKAAPTLPIFVDSPLAGTIARVFHSHPEAFAVDLPGEQLAVRYVASFEESLALLERPGSHIVVAAGGMGDGGRVVGHFAKTLSSASNVVAFVSYQATRSVGRQLLDHPKRITLQGKDCPVRADIRQIEGFSSHADHDDLLSMLAPLASRGTQLRLVHGDLSAAESLEADLRPMGFTDIAIPAIGEAMPLVPQP